MRIREVRGNSGSYTHKSVQIKCNMVWDANLLLNPILRSDNIV